MKTYPLRKFIQRVLVVRLSIATAGIAFVVGLITYGFQHLQLEREVAGRKGELAAIVMKYFSAGMETLHYGEGKQ
jgi:hypothetical protein